MEDFIFNKCKSMLEETEFYLNKNILVNMIKISANTLDPDTKRITIDVPIDYLAGDRLDFFDESYIVTAIKYMVEDLEFLEYLKDRKTYLEERLKEGAN